MILYDLEDCRIWWSSQSGPLVHHFLPSMSRGWSVTSIKLFSLFADRKYLQVPAVSKNGSKDDKSLSGKELNRGRLPCIVYRFCKDPCSNAEGFLCFLLTPDIISLISFIILHGRSTLVGILLTGKTALFWWIRHGLAPKFWFTYLGDFEREGHIIPCLYYVWPIALLHLYICFLGSDRDLIGVDLLGLLSTFDRSFARPKAKCGSLGLTISRSQASHIVV